MNRDYGLGNYLIGLDEVKRAGNSDSEEESFSHLLNALITVTVAIIYLSQGHEAHGTILASFLRNIIATHLIDHHRVKGSSVRLHAQMAMNEFIALAMDFEALKKEAGQDDRLHKTGVDDRANK